MRNNALTKSGAFHAVITGTMAVSDWSASDWSPLTAKPRPWCAKITGSDKTFDFKREFCGCRPQKMLDGKYCYIFYLRKGIYEFRHFRVGDSADLWSGFFQVDDTGAVHELADDLADIKFRFGNVVDHLAALECDDNWDGPPPP